MNKAAFAFVVVLAVTLLASETLLSQSADRKPSPPRAVPLVIKDGRGVPADRDQQAAEYVRLVELKAKVMSEDELQAAIEQTKAEIAARVNPYARAKTLSEALDIYKRRLAKDRKEDFVPLLTEQRVRDAIIKALDSYESLDGRRLSPDFRAAYESIAAGGWPENASFSGFYGLEDKPGIQYDGLGVRLEVTKPGERLGGFALPILDVWYGRFAG